MPISHDDNRINTDGDENGDNLRAYMIANNLGSVSGRNITFDRNLRIANGGTYIDNNFSYIFEGGHHFDNSSSTGGNRPELIFLEDGMIALHGTTESINTTVLTALNITLRRMYLRVESGSQRYDWFWQGATNYAMESVIINNLTTNTSLNPLVFQDGAQLDGVTYLGASSSTRLQFGVVNGAVATCSNWILSPNVADIPSTPTGTGELRLVNLDWGDKTLWDVGISSRPLAFTMVNPRFSTSIDNLTFAGGSNQFCQYRRTHQVAITDGLAPIQGFPIRLYRSNLIDIDYEDSTGINGDIPVKEVLIVDVVNDNTQSRHLDHEIRGYKYGYMPISGLRALQDLDDGLSETVLSVIDASISERDINIVKNYQTIDNSNRFYNAFCNWLDVNQTTETAIAVNLLGSQIDAGDFNVLIDPSAQQVFSIVAQTIIINSTIFEGSITTTGVVTLEEGAVVTEGISDANGVALVVNSNAAWGSFTMLNITKYSTDLGFFTAHTTAQAAITNPNDGDFYRLDDNSEHAYFLNSSWHIEQGRDIHEQTTTAAIIGGTGIAASHVVNAIDGHSYRLAVDAFGLYKQIKDVQIDGLTTTSLNLETNFNVQASRISEALPYLAQIQSDPPTTAGKIRMKLPQFNLNEGDDADVDLASAVLELATLGEPSQSGAVVTNNAALAEIIDAGVLTIKNDTVEIQPLDGKTAADITHIPLVINAVNYTIDPTPLNDTDGRVTYERVTGNIINTGTIVEPRLDAAVAMLPLVESIFADTQPLDAT